MLTKCSRWRGWPSYYYKLLEFSSISAPRPAHWASDWGQEEQGWIGQWETCKYPEDLGPAALVPSDTQVGEPTGKAWPCPNVDNWSPDWWESEYLIKAGSVGCNLWGSHSLLPHFYQGCNATTFVLKAVVFKPHGDFCKIPTSRPSLR